MMDNGRNEIGVEIRSTLNLPSVREMKADIAKLSEHSSRCLTAIKGFKVQIEKQLTEKKQLEALAIDPLGEDGIRYNPEACANAAKRCEKHIGMFKAQVKKEQAKIQQIAGMINEIEKRIWQSEQMSQ